MCVVGEGGCVCGCALPVCKFSWVQGAWIGIHTYLQVHVADLQYKSLHYAAGPYHKAGGPGEGGIDGAMPVGTRPS